MLDYLSRENDLPLCADYADLRRAKAKLKCRLNRLIPHWELGGFGLLKNKNNSLQVD
jgi:hypothetical protein